MDSQPTVITSLLTDLFGFQRSQKKDSANVRLGEIADKREVYEAVVAIPYILEANEDYENVKTDDDKSRKKFISIPRQRFSAALKEREGLAGRRFVRGLQARAFARWCKR